MLYLEISKRTETVKMSRCKIARKLLKIAEMKAEEAVFSGYVTDFYTAYNEYIIPIQDHGCWREE